jgi:cytochrome c
VGAAVYEQKCQACHGAKGAGQPNDRLVGGQGTLASKTPVKTIGSYWPYATTVFDYVRRAMPYQQPQSLSNDEIYAITAYLLHMNGIIGERDEMNAQTLAKVRMPNRDNFVIIYRAP